MGVVEGADKPTEGWKPEGKCRRFVAPTASEVEAYGAEIGFSVDGAAFVDFYESRGWRYGETKIRDWKACVRTWRNRRREETGSGQREEGTEYCAGCGRPKVACECVAGRPG